MLFFLAPLLLLLLFWPDLAEAQSPLPSLCASDYDCSLTGICNATSGICACDSGWVGQFCYSLNLSSVPRGAGDCDPSLNGTATGYMTSWGGLPQHDEATGIWHLHAASMAQHCGMTAWGSQSEVGHYISESGLQGPYKRNGTAVAAFSHNPVVIPVPAGTAGADASYLMLHIGIACNSEGVWKCNYTNLYTCTNGTTPYHPEKPTGPVPNPPDVYRAFTHVASNLSGPWLPMPSHWTLPQCNNNPAPLFLSNGSLMIACHEPMQTMSTCPHSGGLYLATSATANWTMGPYIYQCLNLLNPNVTVDNVTYTTANEDPHLFADKRGNLHILTHNQAPGYQNLSWFGGDVRGDGGHFFSGDGGYTWRFMWHAAYDGLVQYDDGTTKRYKRERPKLVQDPVTLAPLALVSGAGVELVDAFSPGDDCACTIVVGIGQL